MTVVIGLTGSIATGKSTVSKMIQELGLPVVDADKIARQVVEPGENAYNQIVKEFGTVILLGDGTIDRKKLGSIVFTNEEKRQTLNEIVHPEVRKKMKEEKNAYIQAGHKGVVLDIPLLFESKQTNIVDKTIVAYVNEETQLQRLMNRDQSTEEEAKDRIRPQLSIEKKVKIADAVIDNSGSLQETKEQVYHVFKEWGLLPS